MDGCGRTAASVGDEYRRAIGNAHDKSRSRIAGNDPIGGGRLPAGRGSLTSNGDRMAVHLPQEQQMLAPHARERRHGPPLTLILPEA